MIEFIIGLAVGTSAGVGVMVWHTRGVEKAVSKVRTTKDAEIRQLRELNLQLRMDSDTVERSRDCADAYRRGRQDGRSDPMTDAERFAKTFERRRVQFAEQKKSA